MTSYDHLVYSRGFLISDSNPVGLPAHWSSESLGRWTFHYDPATPMSVMGGTLLFGHAVDLGAAISDLSTIAAAVDGKPLSDLQEYLDQLSGRYLVVKSDGERLKIQQDATGMRAVYYTEAMYPFVAGSHQGLVAMQVNAPQGYFGGSFLRDNNVQTHPGRKTQNVGVVRQLPNTELDSISRRTERIFPRVSVEPCTAAEATDVIIETANIQLGAIEQPLMSSLSAGLDSRVTLALLKNAIKDTKFFTYVIADKPLNTGNQHDLSGATDLATRFGLDHETLFVSTNMDDAFESMMHKNAPFSHSRSIAKAYLDYLPHDALHIRSNVFEIGRCYYRNIGMIPNKLSAHSMRYITANGKSLDLPTYDAFEEYRIMTNLDAAVDLGYDELDVFYWEYRMGSWMTSVYHESDVAHDTHTLINSRLVLKKLLGVPLEDRLTGAAFRGTIAKSWPELLEVPVNGVLLEVD